jgi:phosphate transport system substrate-binding protein
MGFPPLLFLFDPRDPASQFWVGLGGLVVAITTVAVSVVRQLLKSGGGAKRLTYEVVSDVGLINSVKDLGSDIELTLDGHTVNDARLIMVRLANAGTEPVAESDLHNAQPVRVEFDPPSIIRCAIHSTEPPNLIPQERLKSFIRLGGDCGGDGEAARSPHAFAELPGMLLNRRESIELKFLTRGRSTLRVIGHLVGGTITEYVPPRPQRRRRIVAGVLAGVLLGSLLTYEVGFIGRFLQGQCTLGPVPLAVNGSSAFYPTAQAEAASYHASCPVAFFSVGSSSSGEGLRMLDGGSVQIADSELSAREAGFSGAGLAEHRVALIVFTMILNGSVTGVHSLTRGQVTAIYSGTVSNWRAVGGPDLPITAVGRPADSGTHAAFIRFVLDAPEKPVGLVESGTGEVIDRVRGTPGAIGYADLGAANRAQGDVVGVALDGSSPTVGLVQSGAYPFWAIERMYTRRAPDGLSVSFIDHVTRDVQTTDTFVRISDVPDAVLASHE